jgi:acid phosphatase (class A)
MYNAAHRLSLLALVGMLAACSTATRPSLSVAEIGEHTPGMGAPKGYLKDSEMPDSLALLPAPPANGSAAQAADEAAHRILSSKKSGPRWEMAAKDAELRFPAAASTFACAVGVEISERHTPHLNMLLRRSMIDAGMSSYGAKNKYQRVRPFVQFNESTCFPKDDDFLRQDGSYPSGHSAIGWAWALVLTEIAPERADALLQRGRAFAQSRAVCGVHWMSDVETGRLMGAAAVARLHANATFKAQLALAKEEIVQANAKGLTPDAATCAAEHKALLPTALQAP